MTSLGEKQFDRRLILMFCTAFGLSMGYEVFLLSRIKEEFDRSHDNTRAVALGLERTGRIVTAAAALLAVTFAAIGTSNVTFIKMFGLGLALAVVMDSTIIRGPPFPAFMRLADDANWWAPNWMRRIHNRIGIHESESNDAAADHDPVAPRQPGRRQTRSTPSPGRFADDPNVTRPVQARAIDPRPGRFSRWCSRSASTTGTESFKLRTSSVVDVGLSRAGRVGERRPRDRMLRR